MVELGKEVKNKIRTAKRFLVPLNRYLLLFSFLTGLTISCAPDFSDEKAKLYNFVKGKQMEYLVGDIYQEMERPTAFFSSDLIGIRQTQVYNTGILDLFYRSRDGWEPFNNLTVDTVTEVPALWDLNRFFRRSANSEINGARIEPRVKYDSGISKKIGFQFSPLPNGAHFELEANLVYGAPEIEFQVIPKPDSLPIKRLALANSYGVKERVDLIEVNGQLVLAQSLPKPRVDRYVPGPFQRLPLPDDWTILFWGEDSPIKQYQKLITQNGRIYLEAELRDQTWFGKPLGKNIFEMVRLVQEPFNSQTVVKIGYELIK